MDIRFQYLIPNDADEQFGCTVSTVGSQIIDPDDDYPSKDHPPGYMFDPERGRDRLNRLHAALLCDFDV